MKWRIWYRYYAVITPVLRNARCEGILSDGLSRLYRWRSVCELKKRDMRAAPSPNAKLGRLYQVISRYCAIIISSHRHLLQVRDPKSSHRVLLYCIGIVGNIQIELCQHPAIAVKLVTRIAVTVQSAHPLPWRFFNSQSSYSQRYSFFGATQP